MRSLLLSLLLVPALASAGSKDAISAPPHAPMPQDLPVIGDLAPDPDFGGGNGFVRIDYLGANGHDQGLRVFPAACGVGCEKYYVLGMHAQGASGWEAVISRIDAKGEFDSTFGIGLSGTLIVPTTLNTIADAAVNEDGTRFYFAGTKLTNLVAFDDFAIACIDANGAPCAGFGTAGLVTKGFDLSGSNGGSNDDNAQRIVYRPAQGANAASLFVGGVATGGLVTAPSERVGVLMLDPVTGAGKPGVGHNTGKITLQIGPLAAGAGVRVNDMALSAPDTQGGERLYVAGVYKRNDTDTDGFLLALDPDTGAYVNSFAGGEPLSIGNYTGPSGNPYDAVTAIAVQPDGKVVMAGQSLDANAHPQLLLARMNLQGEFDA